MNKVLEAFERIKKGVDDNIWDGNEYDDLDIIENALKEGKKNKQALKIIKEHVLYCENVDCFVFANITKEVNDLLKKVLL